MTLLFDSNAHPTVTGKWPEKNLDASFSHYRDSLAKASFMGGCAVGLEGFESYQHAEFVAQCKIDARLIPIAGMSLRANREILVNELNAISKFGYRGIKIHPKHPRISLTDPALEVLFQEAGNQKLAVFWCTYYPESLKHHPDSDPFFSLVGLLKKAPQTKVVLVHGGGVELLRYAELVRFNDNLLLDLSQTLMKYEGSSIDQDLKFLFQRFDRRISIGSDFPEYSLADVRRRFDEFEEDLSAEKAENIAYRNIQSFLGAQIL